MSKFTLGGVPHHAYDLFHQMYDRVNGSDGEKWSSALAALINIGDPVKARRLLEAQRVYSEGIFGTISTVVVEGRTAFVHLDIPIEGLSAALISEETKGRIQLMNTQKDGKLKMGMPVFISQWRKGPEAIVALQISAP